MKRREPDFENMRKVLKGEVPARPVLFELFMNMDLYKTVNGGTPEGDDLLSYWKFVMNAYIKLGYDYFTMQLGFGFPNRSHKQENLKTISLNDSVMIDSWESFEKYPWPDSDKSDYSILDSIGPYLPDGMQMMVMGPGGVIENVISLVGYDNLCYMTYEDPELLQAIFDGVGSRMVRYYQNVLQHRNIGLICSNDDWGFNTQTFLSPADMRKYVFPWHKKIVEAAHGAGKPVMLHSCGNLREVMEDVVGDMKYDAKHSFEDVIMPIEDFYEKWHSRIALLGGIDMNYICTKSVEEVKSRTSAMLERTASRGGWAVGTGNSIPAYVPLRQFLGMIEAAIGYNPME